MAMSRSRKGGEVYKTNAQSVRGATKLSAPLGSRQVRQVRHGGMLWSWSVGDVV